MRIFGERNDISNASRMIQKAKKQILLAKGEMVYANFLLSASIHEKFDDLYREYRSHFSMHERELDILSEKYDLVYESINLAYNKLINRYQIVIGAIGLFFGLLGILSMHQ